ncbi:MAG: SpoIID/LytB domain-containing protein, partial [Clostridia bacterium]|nr:SpoIID/LytB domain-containing protein [Clostridia bacterium]
NHMANGMSRTYILSGFVGSDGFRNLCGQYGIKPGTVNLTQNRDQNTKVTAFVQSFYKGLFKTGGDEGGLNNWTGWLLNGSKDGTDILIGFINSPSMQNSNLSDRDYIIRMYNVAFNRNPVESEISDWKQYLDYGCTRDYLTQGFANSDGFMSKCTSAGVKYHTYTASDVCDKNWKTTKFVNDYYKCLLGSTAKTSHTALSNMINLLNNGTYSGATLAKMFFESQESKNYFASVDDNQKVILLFNALFGRTPYSPEISTRAQQIRKNGVESLFKELLKSTEYQNYAKKMGVTPGGFYGTLTVTDENGNVHTGDAVEILAHIVSGEVGSMANVEVFKAQAIAAHSWILRQNQLGTKAPTVAWGSSVSATITQSVEDVVDKVVYYNGSPALTTYFASCNNATNSSAEVWGNSLPYLVTVASSYDSAVDSNWKVSKTLNEKQLKEIVNKIYYSSKKGNPEYTANQHAYWAHITATNKNNGYVERVQSNVRWYNDDTNTWQTNTGVKGLYFMQKANQALGDGIVRSPNFTITYNNNYTWTITSYGYGHGVGMSQWGAYGYATKANWSYTQILQHYYPGTTINKIGF